ncbi:MAG: winged helix-turn-helix transcriptional regulator [Sphingomonadales bacterium]|nr:winged helix-turn-helix transcriptional regulator [Sphingomonadales bacterium]
MTAGQWPVLVHLWETDGLSQRELCERIDIEEATMTRTIDGMERAGLVERVRSPGNRSRYSIRLTPKAIGLRNTLLPAMNDMLKSATQGFAPHDVERTRDLLIHLIEWSRDDLCGDHRTEA